MGAALYASADLVVRNHTVAPPAMSAQKAAIDQRLREAFGGAYRATDYSVTTTGFEDAATVTAYFGSGMAEVSWPDQWDFTVHVMWATDEPSGAFSVPGAAAARRPVGDKDAVLIAQAYADRFAPWGTRNAKVQVARPDDGSLSGWLDGSTLLVDESGRFFSRITRAPTSWGARSMRIMSLMSSEMVDAEDYFVSAHRGESGRGVMRGTEW